jgi:transaldolase
VAKTLEKLKVKIYADGADRESMLELNANPLVQGMTTNPTLMYKAGIRDYEAFAKDVLKAINSKPISFEVFSDEFPRMFREALKIASWQQNVYVKVPITNTHGQSSLPLIKELSERGVKLNVTAVLTLDQVQGVAEVLHPAVPSIVSVFAGRIADTGRDPDPMMRQSLALLAGLNNAQLLWASVREVWNIFQADDCGCHIVTVPPEILAKAHKMVNIDLTALSLETVRMFSNDACSAGFNILLPDRRGGRTPNVPVPVSQLKLEIPEFFAASFEAERKQLLQEDPRSNERQSSH